MTTNHIKFLPIISIPLVFDMQRHIQEPYSFLELNHPLYQPKQVINIKAVIRLYEEKEIDSTQQAWVIEGKLVIEEEVNNCAGSV